MGTIFHSVFCQTCSSFFQDLEIAGKECQPVLVKKLKNISWKLSTFLSCPHLKNCLNSKHFNSSKYELLHLSEASVFGCSTNKQLVTLTLRPGPHHPYSLQTPIALNKDLKQCRISPLMCTIDLLPLGCCAKCIKADYKGIKCGHYVLMI